MRVSFTAWASTHGSLERTEDSNDALAMRCSASGGDQALRKRDIPLAQHDRLDGAKVVAITYPIDRGRLTWQRRLEWKPRRT